MKEKIGSTFYGDGIRRPLYFNNDTIYENDEMADIQELVWLLSNPWDKIRYYIDNKGKHHYLSIVYDDLSIDIQGNTIEDMLSNVAVIFKLAIE